MGCGRLSHRFTAQETGRLDLFLAKCFPEQSRSKLQKLIDGGEVKVDGEVVFKSGFSLAPGMEVLVEPPTETPPHELEPVDIPLETLFEDDHLLVVSKPRGMATHPAPNERDPTLVHALLARNHGLSQEAGAFRPGIVHRLDKATTGLLVVAKTDAAHRNLSDQIQAKTAERAYVAIIRGQPTHDRFTIDAPIGRNPAYPTRMTVKRSGRSAVTHVKLLERLDEGSLVALKLETGRTHQIRVHLSEVNHPVKGDILYARESWREGPLQLHAAWLAFNHPVEGHRIGCFCAPPQDFLAWDKVSEAQLDPW